jgi:hypothetical protein
MILLAKLSLAQNIKDPLLDLHNEYVYDGIQERRFGIEDLIPVIEKLKKHEDFAVEEAGRSIEDRPIYHIQWGDGDLPILLWSQMHGDEPTATMALMDIFLFLMDDKNDSELKQTLRKELRIHFIPMLNPDGAEEFKRRNAIDIDLNRDALRLIAPESRILKEIRDKYDPVFGFNLHDQSRYYTSGTYGKQASLSFLAPAYNHEKDINEVRERAIQLIGFCNEWLQEVIPGRVGRYDDTFEPRAFGDNIQKWGTSTVLIESGGLSGDREKQILRKIHFALLLRSLEAIALKGYGQYKIEDYLAIPENERYLHDLMIRNANIQTGHGHYTLDLAFRHDEVAVDNSDNYFIRAFIADQGDLSTYRGYIDLNLSEYTLKPGKVYPTVYASILDLNENERRKLVRDGYLYAKVNNGVRHSGHYPLILSETGKPPIIATGKNPALRIYKGDVYEGFLSNGHIYWFSESNKDFTLVEEPAYDEEEDNIGDGK